MSSEINTQHTETINVQPVAEDVQAETTTENVETQIVSELEEKPDSEEAPEYVPTKVYEISELASLPDNSREWVRVNELKFKPEINPRVIVDDEGKQVFNEDGTPKVEVDEDLVSKYMAISDFLCKESPITVNQYGEIIDGNHRAIARIRKGRLYILVLVRFTKSLSHEKMLASQGNLHGKPVEVKQKAIRVLELWGDGVQDAEILTAYGISQSYLNKLTKAKRDERKAQERQHIFDLWIRGETDVFIASQIGKPRQRVSEITKEIAGFATSSETGNFLDYAHKGSSLRVSTIWEFESVSVMPAETFENLLYYYTEPKDVIFAPFCVNESIIDVCTRRFRRYYVSDKNPVREDIRTHDISTGLPEVLPMPRVVFLNPFDNGNNLDLNPETIGNIAKDIKKKWDDSTEGGRKGVFGYFIFVTAMDGNLDGKTKSVSDACYEHISKHFNRIKTVTVYSSKLDSDAVEEAVDKRELFDVTRNVIIFTNGRDKPTPVKKEVKQEVVTPEPKEAPEEAVPPVEEVPVPEPVPEPVKETPTATVPEPEVASKPEVKEPVVAIVPKETKNKTIMPETSEAIATVKDMRANKNGKKK